MEKKNKVITSQEEFLAQVDPQTLGCIWVTETQLDKREKPFLWFDYLLDGILEKHIIQAPPSAKSFFTADQFERHFYVLQVEKTYPGLDQVFKDSLKLMKKTNDQKKILCLSTNAQVFSVPSLKNFKDLDFENLIY